jgi:anti-sigma28 factor (negative regulator of flagellin synthesis)
MKIVESDALKTQKPQSGKVYEPSKASRREGVAGRPAPAQDDSVAEDGIALNSHDQLQALAMAVGAGQASRVQQLTQLVQSGQYQVDYTALGGAIVGSMLKGY